MLSSVWKSNLLIGNMSAPMMNCRRILGLLKVSTKFRRFLQNQNYMKNYGRILFSKLKTLTGSWKFNPSNLILLQAIALFEMSKSSKSQEKEIPASTESMADKILETADKLYSEFEVTKLYDYLYQFKDCDNDEILWRLARAATDKGKASGKSEEKKACIYEAYGYIQRALEINKYNYACHKWYAILLDYTGEYEGTKKRISNAYLVKEHFIKAIQLNPKDATSIHSLGFWCFTFADLPWYARKIAGALFTSPPTSTYEEALNYFKQAEDVDPNFYSMNLLMIGKTYVRLKNFRLALLFLSKAKDYPVKTPDDQKAHTEAVELLKSLGVKAEE